MFLYKLQQWKVLQLLPRNWAHQVPMLLMIFNLRQNPKNIFYRQKSCFLSFAEAAELGSISNKY